MKITKEILYKATTKPGLCTQDEIYCAINFLTNFKEHQDLFKEACSYIPQGNSLQFILEGLDWYIKDFKTGETACVNNE